MVEDDVHVEDLKEMIGGWFVGNFNPSVLQSKEFEVAVKRYQAGDCEERHCHKLATEITLIISGEVRMNDVTYQADDIVILEPGDWTDFTALTDAVNVVVKTPSLTDDKYLEGE